MFRLNAVPQFVVKIASNDQIIACPMRYPTDKEWCDRVKGLKVIQHQIGRGKHTTDVPGEYDAAADLFARVRMDEPRQVIDKFEASEFIKKIDRCELLDAIRHGNQVEVNLGVHGGTVTHLLRIPSQKDVAEFERSSLHLIGGKRQTEITSSLEPAGVLFDKVVVSSEGYAAAVPITHKYSAVRELLDQIETIAGDDIELPGEE
jgi:tRNA isopentenyl-2-thiomethyl-A-37 hydroxylase MiaE